MADHKALADAESPAIFAAGLEQGAPLPAFLLMHGDQDALVSSLQSQRLYNALLAHGGSADLQLQILKGHGHGGGLWADDVATVIEFAANRFGM